MTSPPLITGPIPPYSNPPIEPQFYKPSQFVITAISLGITTMITTSVNNNYVVGQEIRLLIPPYSGARGLNGETGFVIAIPSPNQVTLDIDSIGVDPFIFINLSNKFRTPAQIIAIGDENSGAINLSRSNQTTFIPGSFINISPK